MGELGIGEGPPTGETEEEGGKVTFAKFVDRLGEVEGSRETYTPRKFKQIFDGIWHDGNLLDTLTSRKGIRSFAADLLAKEMGWEVRQEEESLNAYCDMIDFSWNGVLR